MSETNWPPLITPPPSVSELITDDGEPMESNRHVLQMILLRVCLELAWKDRRDFFVGTNMALYYSALQAKKNDFRGPDVFVVLGTEHRDRKAWVIWEEDGRHPDVVIELTSESTEQVDRGDKKRIYGAVIGVPEYFIYDPFAGTLDGYRLNAGRRVYEPLRATAEGRIPSEPTGLQLGPWSGSYENYEGVWLRWFTPDGTMLPTPDEALAQAEHRARDMADRLAAYERRFGKLSDES